MQHNHEPRHDPETSLTTVVDAVAGQIDEPTLDLIRHFIANRDYGVAIEWLLDVPNVLFSEAQIAEIECVAAQVEIKISVGSSSHQAPPGPGELGSNKPGHRGCC